MKKFAWSGKRGKLMIETLKLTSLCLEKGSNHEKLSNYPVIAINRY